MNLNFGTNNYIVRYLQTFLKDNYSNELVVTGIFDQSTQDALIGYLELSNVEQQFDVEDGILERFPDLNRLFTITENNDELLFTSKSIDKETSDFITLTIDEIISYLESVGWVVDEYKDYVNWNYDVNGDNSIDNMDKMLVYNYINNGGHLTDEQLVMADFNNDGRVDEKDLKIINDYLLNGKLFIKVASSGRKNYFPNKDMLPMVNLFPGEFLYGKAIRSREGTSDFIHDDIYNEYKICLIKCKSNTKYTIVHGASETSRLLIGSYVGKRTNLTTLKVENIVDINLAVGTPYIYETTEDATYIVVQCESTMGYPEKAKPVTVDVLLGDINDDGKIDIYDKKILSDYLFYPEGDSRRPILTAKQKVAADINRDGKIDQDDMQLMSNYLNRDPGSTINLGVIDYTYYVAPDSKEEDRIARLLVVEGDITVEKTGEVKSLDFKEKQNGQIYGSISCSDITDWKTFIGTVELRNGDDNEIASTFTLNGTQNYLFENVNNGKYKIIINSEGFSRSIITDINVKKGFKLIIQNIEITRDSGEENTFIWDGTSEELPIKETTIEYEVTKSKYGINFLSFTEDPWIVHDKFIPYLLGMAIHKYSRSEEITYVQDILRQLYPTRVDDYIAGHYSETMKELVLQYQKEQFNLNSGDLDGDGRITEQDEKMVREYLDGERELSQEKIKIGDTNGDTYLDEIDYENIRKYRERNNRYIKYLYNSILFRMG